MASDRFAPEGSLSDTIQPNQSYGLLTASDLRKSRLEASEQLEHDGGSRDTSRAPSGAATPSDRTSTPQSQLKKKRKPPKGKLSFAFDEDDAEERPRKKKPTGVSSAHGEAVETPPLVSGHSSENDDERPFVKRRMGPNASIGSAPKIMTKSALQKEAIERDRLRQEFLSMQEEVKATEIAIPFVFYDGTNVPGGTCRVKKGDPIWLFLDKCRKLGAELAIGSSNEAKSRREWARVGVDDLMLVRGEIIIPHHYEFYYFIVNKTVGYDSTQLFAYSAKPTDATRAKQAAIDAGTYNPLSRPGETTADDSLLEGSSDDANLTKVVNRQWYERNKHIFPASTWEEFDATKDYTVATRRDAQGNAYFFS